MARLDTSFSIPQGLNRLRKNPIGRGFVTGHDFSRADKDNKTNGLYRLRKNLFDRGFVSGHDFSRADEVNKINGLYRLRKKSQVIYFFSTGSWFR